MKKKIKYTDEPLAMGERVKDFLPPPSQLVKREATTTITLEVTTGSLAFFKKHSARARIPYQHMMRRLIDSYAQSFAENEKHI